MIKIITALIIFLVTWPSFAADLNGYTAQYECRAGGPNCNVDIATYVSQACQQTITTADSTATISNKINGGSQYICVANGDYTGKGTITISASGTSGARKVLRYTRSGDGDNNDEPWNQSGANQATLSTLNVNANYWIIHRLKSTSSVNVGNFSNVIFNRILVENYNGNLVFLGENNSNNTVQNSVIRNTQIGGTSDKHCISTSYNNAAPGHHVVNNEIYNCQGDGVQRIQVNTDTYDLVIENNDFYVDSTRYTAGGTRSCTENGIDLKHGGTSTSPIRIIHNRFWGFRLTDSSCADGSFGEAIIFHETNGANDHNSYGLVQNNIFTDVPIAIASPNQEAGGPDHWSILGNLMFDFHGVSSGTYAIDLSSAHTEAYLNTVISAFQKSSAGWLHYNSEANQDIRCNVVIDGGTANTFGTGTSSQIDNNVYYGNTTGVDPNKIVRFIATRANSITYSLNQIVRTTSSANSCVNGTESACFLYKVTQAGTSAGSASSYCAMLGCVQTDGTVTLRAIRGPYTFYRKLRTSPETYSIPYARVYVDTTNISQSAPEINSCPSSYASRRGIGIGDAQ